MSHNTIKVDGLSPDSTSKFVTKEYIQYGRGETPPSPSITVVYNGTYPFYDTAPVNTIQGATLNQTGDVLDSVDLPAGKYLVWMNTGAVDLTSSTWWTSYNFKKSGISYTNIATIVGSYASAAIETYEHYLRPSYLILTSSLNCIAVNTLSYYSSRTSTSSRYAETSSLTILKVG